VRNGEGGGVNGAAAGSDEGGVNGAAAGSGALGGTEAGSAGAYIAGGAGAIVAEAGSGGEGGAVSGTRRFTVRGKVLNIWNYPLPNVPVVIGDTRVETDADGYFTVEDVSAPYDVLFSAAYEDVGGVKFTTAWVYQGVTRDDPILHAGDTGHVYDGGELELLTTGTGDDSYIQVAYAAATPYGSRSKVANYWGASLGMLLSGATASPGTGHALSFFLDADGLPERYVAYDEQEILVNSAESSPDYVFDLTPPEPALPTGQIRGSITSRTSDQRVDAIWLEFASYASVELAQHVPTESSFDYLVPGLPDATVTLVASSGGQLSSDAWAIAYRAELSPGQNGIEIEIPAASALHGPIAGAEGGVGTEFTWDTSFAVSMLHITQHASKLRHLYVITSKKSATLSEAMYRLAGFEESPINEWTVETHAGCPDMDAATGAEGFLDPYARLTSGRGPQGPRRRTSGSFTAAPPRGLILLGAQ
jgi:hypothetical protein